MIGIAAPMFGDCAKVLDLGCGDGGVMRLLKPFLPPSCRLIGIDPDPWETGLAKASGVYEEVFCCGGEKTPLPDSGVDAIFSNSVLEHIDPIDAVLRECSRVLRPNGLFVATVPGPHFHSLLRNPLSPWKARDRYLRDLDQRLRHLRYWNEGEWREHMADAGLSLIETHPYLSASETRRWELLSGLTGGLLHSLSGGKSPPIQIQRNLGIRGNLRLPSIVAKFVGSVITPDLRPSVDGKDKQGCLLLIGRKAKI